MDHHVGDVVVEEKLPGGRSTISLAGTRLSERLIQRYSCACLATSRSKKSGCAAVTRAAQRRLLEKRWARERILRLDEMKTFNLLVGAWNA
jgi:hypothetical protein